MQKTLKPAVRRYAPIAFLFVALGFLVAGEFVAAWSTLVQGTFYVSLPLIEGTREFGVIDSPDYRWEVIAIDGKPLTAARQALEAAQGHRDGDRLTLTLRGPHGETRPLERPVVHKYVDNPVSFAATYLFLPVFCFLVAFTVVAIRPRDGLAWLLFALLTSFAETAHGVVWQWPGKYNFAAVHGLIGDSWPVWMLMFGVWFPTRHWLDEKLPWLKWLLTGTIAAAALFTGAVEFTWVRDIDAALPFRKAFAIANRVQYIAAMIAISSFFAAFSMRSSRESQPDARRRIAFIWAGSSISLTPMLLVALYALFTGQDPSFVRIPQWLYGIAVGMLALFPVVLAYVIVVQRAMNLRVAVRMGIRYTLARGGIRVARLVILAVLAWLMSRGGIAHNIWPPVYAAVALALLRKRLTLRITDGLDRKFFREAYDSERVLAELSEEARTYTEAAPLLVTVTERISRTLHAARAAVLLPAGDRFCLATATGPALGAGAGCLPLHAKAIERVRDSRKPAVIYYEDEESWVREVSDDERSRLRELNAEVLLPLTGRTDLYGVMILGPKLSEEPYSGDDLRLLQSVATQTGMALENCDLLQRLSAEAARRERLNRELEIAREVQQRLFPQECPSVEGLEYAGRCRPALGIGGDYYDFIQLPGGRLGIAIGDVSGKGVAAALLMSNLHASLRAQTLARLSDLPALMRNVNQMIFEASASNRYATFFYGEYSPQKRVLSYVNAGHNAPMVVRGSECLRLEATGPVVGLLKETDFDSASIELQPGDLLVGYTDGISEAMREDDEEWGEERLLEVLQTSRDLAPGALIDRVIAEADLFTQGAMQYDDMTLLAVRIR